MHTPQLYQDERSPATISKIVAAVKWTVKNHSETIPCEITEKTLAGIRRKGKNRGRGQVDGITWEEVEQVCALAQAEGTIGRWQSPRMPVHYARAELAEQGGIARFKYGK